MINRKSMDKFISQPDMLDEADYELFKFNKLNSCSSAKLI